MKSILTLLILILTTSATFAAHEATIMVRPESETSGTQVLLAEIATVQSADETLAQRLRQAEISSSPLPGRMRKLTKEQIRVALRRAGISDSSVEILSPAEITVTRSALIVTGEALFDTAREFVLAGNPFGGTVTIEPVRIQPDQAVPTGELNLRVKPGTREDRKGQVSLPVEIMIDNQVYRTISVTVMVRVSAPVLVATETIARLTEISPMNVSLQERDITTLPSDVMLEKPEENWIANIPISEGAVIRQGWVARPLAVRSGDEVHVVVEAGSVKVTDKGTAIQDGRPGERIRVRLQGNIREVRGTVIEPGIIMISVPERTGTSIRRN